MSERLTPQREAEIAERTPKRAAALTAWLNQFSPVGGQRDLENAETVLEEDVPALLAELSALRAERDSARAALRDATEQIARLDAEYGEATAHITELQENLRAVKAGWDVAHARVAELEAERHERVLVPRWEYELMELQRERAATAEARIAELEATQLPADEDPDDNRRRLYIDGKGNGWISVCQDEGTEWVVPVQPEGAVEQDVRDVADETGSLREIGRCW